MLGQLNSAPFLQVFVTTVAPFSSFLAKLEISVVLVIVISFEKTRRLCPLNRRRRLFVSLESRFAAGGDVESPFSHGCVSFLRSATRGKEKKTAGRRAPSHIISLTCAVLSRGLSRAGRGGMAKDGTPPLPTEKERLRSVAGVARSPGSPCKHVFRLIETITTS